jgi:hypothetical protein
MFDFRVQLLVAGAPVLFNIFSASFQRRLVDCVWTVFALLNNCFASFSLTAVAAHDDDAHGFFS